MGFKPSKKHYQLVFEGDLEGLEVVARGTSMGKLIELSKMDIKVGVTAEEQEKALSIFQEFETCLVTWNVDHPELRKGTDGKVPDTCIQCGLAEGDSLPSTLAGMMCLDFDFVIDIILAWMSAIARVSDPKGLNLNGGGKSSLEEAMSNLGSKASPLTSPLPN